MLTHQQKENTKMARTLPDVTHHGVTLKCLDRAEDRLGEQTWTTLDDRIIVCEWDFQDPANPGRPDYGWLVHDNGTGRRIGTRHDTVEAACEAIAAKLAQPLTPVDETAVAQWLESMDRAA